MKRIVVVDDQPVLASIYRSKFTAEGFHVDVAVDGEAALEVIQRSRPDLVLLDLMLPKIKGIDVLKTLRAQPSFKTLPILVFSSSAQPGLVEEAWAAGASMVLSKTRTSPKQLIETVLSTLAGKSDEEVVPDSSEMVEKASHKKIDDRFLKRILLLETSAEVRAMLALVTSREGFQITNAEGCAHAAMLTEVTHFDLVMVNQAVCSEPVDRFCQQMRRRAAKLPVIMYSANATPAEARQALDQGVSEFITNAEALLDVGVIARRLLEANRKAA